MAYNTKCGYVLSDKDLSINGKGPIILWIFIIAWSWKKTEVRPRKKSCLENFQLGNDVLHTKCLHIFHKKCLECWMEQKKSCPICSRKLTKLRSPTLFRRMRMTIDDIFSCCCTRN